MMQEITASEDGNGRMKVWIEDPKGLCWRCDSLEKIQIILETPQATDKFIAALVKAREEAFGPSDA